MGSMHEPSLLAEPEARLQAAIKASAAAAKVIELLEDEEPVDAELGLMGRRKAQRQQAEVHALDDACMRSCAGCLLQPADTVQHAASCSHSGSPACGPIISASDLHQLLQDVVYL